MDLIYFRDISKVGCRHFLSAIPVYDMFFPAAMGIVFTKIEQGAIAVCLLKSPQL